MAGEPRGAHSRRSERAAETERPREDQHAEPTPGLTAVKAMEAQGDAAAQQVANILRQHPQERDEILQWVQQHRGNQFTQLVRGKLGTVEQAMPEGFDLTSVRASVMLPGHKMLYGSMLADVSTARATMATAEITPTGVHISLSPGLFVDAQWPLRNANVRSAGIDFTTGKAFANITNGTGAGSGMISIEDRLNDTITGALDRGVAGTPLARPGYSPTRDPHLSQTLQKVVSSIQHIVSNEDAGSKATAKKSPITPAELDNVSVGATVNARLGGNFIKDGSGLVIAPGSDLSVDVDGDGSVGDVMAKREPGQQVEAAKLRGVRISAGDMTVQAKGKPVAKISALTIHPGGKVTIDHMELLGKLAEARNTEGGLALLVSIIAAASGDLNTANRANDYANRPPIVDGVSRRLIEQQFTQSVTDMVIANRHAVPGVDLAAALHIG